MISSYKRGNYREHRFNTLNKSAEMVITNGLVVLDNAKLNYCDLNNIVVHLSYLENDSLISVKKPLSKFINTPTGNGYKVDFLSNVNISCWINITQPTRLKINVTGMGNGTIHLEYFVLRLF